MFALTTVVRRPDGSSTITDGSLFKLPAELVDPPRIRKYSSIAAQGWGVSEFGYAYFARANSDGELLIFPGLIIEGNPRPTKKFTGYTLQFSRGQIELFANQIVAASDDAKVRAQTDLNMLIHDLRSLSTAIYNAAEETSTFIDQRNFGEASVRIKNVIAAQTILKIRTDLLDFSGNTSAQISPVDVPIFQRVDKVTRCFRPRAAELAQALYLTGHSFKRSRGPNVFEIVPYVLIDNALKYSNPGNSVQVDVQDSSTSIEFRVISEGPPMSAEEMTRIFDKGFRGQTAIISGKQGSGLGLFLAARIVREYFNGSITVAQEPVPQPRNRSVKTEFLVTLPAVGA